MSVAGLAGWSRAGWAPGLGGGGGERGRARVAGGRLAEITRGLRARPAGISEEADGQTVTLTCGQAEFGLVCLPVADYPMLPPSPDPVGVIGGDVLAGAVAQV